MQSPFIERLLQHVPELKPAHEEHLNYYDELLPHVLMGDFTRQIVKASEDGRNLPWLNRLLRFFESELSTRDPEAEDLIRASFCENLTEDPGAMKLLLPLMGPFLRRATEEGGW